MAIPGIELIGQNARVTDGVYTDDYMVALNQFATVDEVFGADKVAISEREMKPICNLVMDTLGAYEYETHLVDLVIAAARAGTWMAVKRKPMQIEGLAVVVEKHFGHRVDHEGETFLLPSTMYLIYCKLQKDNK